MRLLFEPTGLETLEELLAAGRAASEEGLDGVLLAPSPELPSPLVTAAALAAGVPDILIAAEVPIGDRHPLEVAEEAAVVDLGSGGRLVLVVRPADGAEDVFEEALDLLRTALTPRPFRWPGPHWPTPANLAQNVNNPEARTRMMPSPSQPRLTVWGGTGAGAAAVARGLGHLAGGDEDGDSLGELWADEGPAGLGAPRGRRERWQGAEQLVEQLLAGRDRFGQDWAAVRASVDDVAALGRWVRPRVQLDVLPPGLEEHWDR